LGDRVTEGQKSRSVRGCAAFDRVASGSRKSGTPVVSSPSLAFGARRFATFARVRAMISSRWLVMNS
jgi:hypothetical protein